jgi:hypothetical protein
MPFGGPRYWAGEWTSPHSTNKSLIHSSPLLSRKRRPFTKAPSTKLSPFLKKTNPFPLQGEYPVDLHSSFLEIFSWIKNQRLRGEILHCS